MPRANSKKSKKEKSTENQLTKCEVDSEFNKLKRVIYLTDLTSRYIAGNQELFFLRNYANNLSFISDLLKTQENLQEFLYILKKANDDSDLPRRVTLLYVLAYALRKHSSDEKVTNQIAGTVLEICKTDEEFFKVISLFSLMGKHVKPEESYNKITTSISRIIRKFFEKKNPSEYAQAVASSNGHHGWKYKDLIKLSHYKSETSEKLLVTNYVLFGLERLTEDENEESKKIRKTLQDWNTLRQPNMDIDKICDLVVELKATFKNVNSKYVKKQEVWAAIISQMNVEDLMAILPMFLKYNMLEPMETSVLYAKVIEILSTPKVELGKVNPLEIFIHYKNFHKGGKPTDPKLEHYLKINKLPIKGPNSLPEDNEISKILFKSFNDFYPLDPTVLGLNRNVMLILDNAQCENLCFKQKNVTCLEAEVALATYFSKTERNIEINVFGGETLEKFDLEIGSGSFGKNLEKLKAVTTSRINVSSAFVRAVEMKKNVDVFIFLIPSVKSLPTNAKDFRKGFKDALKEYQTHTLDMKVKVIVICLGSHSLAPFPESMNALTICGFCPEIPKVIRSFVNMDIDLAKPKEQEKKD